MTADVVTGAGGIVPPAPAVPALEVKNLTKTFAGTRALNGVDIAFKRGAITALLGPNGCGKSTLIKILAGFHRADDGSRILIGGTELEAPYDSMHMRNMGLRFLHQDLGLVDEMDVADNFGFADDFGGQQAWFPVRRGWRVARARAALARLNIDIAPTTLVGGLSRTEQIMVGVARAFEADKRDPSEQVIVLDEPTASLPSGSVDQVLEAVRQIRATGGTVIYVTHRIDEVLQIAEDVVVLRDGSVSSQQPLGDLDADGLATLIRGTAEARPLRPRRAREGATSSVLRFDRVSGRRLAEVSFDVTRGEILGVAGLAGCGRSELARIAAGVTAPAAGQVNLNGEAVTFRDVHDALSRGVAFAPANRSEHGVIGELSVRQNVVLANLAPFWSKGVLRRKAEQSEVASLLDRFDVRPRDSEVDIRQLSGGNQQKCVIAKFMRLDPQLLIVDEPTQGIDLSGKQDVSEILRDAAESGCAIVLASSDFDEIADLCDRVLVLDRGVALGIFDRGEIHEHELTMMSVRGGREDHAT
jgi:ribose transport system ATP-binding protein